MPNPLKDKSTATLARRKVHCAPLGCHHNHIQIFAFPSGVHTFPNAKPSESTITTTPNVTHAYAGNRFLECHAYFVCWGPKLGDDEDDGEEEDVSLRKQAAGKMNARAVAETPPVISSMTPRSQVMRETEVYGVNVKYIEDGG